ncbi:major facilitator superfamily MFS_1 [Xylanimonas cellulosilytica DSM 15894]|uniref:Major facilitator superfamily MFS_1 n=1 Tax=Xylanimonas cellulosilytica (strain DSM 15894 / JCM 12276 / CECT 5975 / KCTC 9989 / LMG 20990 / NBRC 107835 / XIL07) TaxID=446471 RepID=D1BSA4_XYLCX|nr:MFS transporter [Xylanimonas cellulosilytica]ACZ30596.1 major facilitator superfamily MFS_1 [Xylanimonas cellulosilytica DSM 15894]
MPQRGLTTAVPAASHHWWPVAAVMAAVAWGGNQFTPLLVMYRAGGLHPVTVDALLGAYVLGIVPALLLGGPLSDRHGRRPLLLPAAPVAALGSLVLALGADTPWVLGVGRVLSGVALGLVMAVGTTWVTELAARGGDDAAGARRASLALTAGFLVGAGVASALAQWAPWPHHLTYLLHVALAAAAAVWVLRVPETVAHTGARLTRLRDDLRVPAVAHRRFLRVVVPTAPWVFGSAGAAYAVLPSLLADHAGTVPIAFAGLMTVLTLGCGIGIQVVARRIDTHRSARASVVAMGLIVVGLGLGALAAYTLSLVAGLVAAAVLGVGYGLALVAGLSEVTRIAEPRQLAGLTAVYYSLAYLGFFVPMVLAWLARTWTYAQMFAAGTVLAAVCLGIVAAAWKAHLPGARDLASAHRPG